jgi:hypothetical protein
MDSWWDVHVTLPEAPSSARRGRSAKTRTHDNQWRILALVGLLAVVMGGLCYAMYPRASASSVLEPQAGAAPGPAAGSADAAQVPVPIKVATAKLPKSGAPAGKAAGPTTTSTPHSGTGPLAGGSYAGSLVLNDTGSSLTSWNQTSSYCPATNNYLADGTVGTDSSGGVTLSTSSKPGSCVALISPSTYSSAVIEAEMYYPAVPGKPGTIANWSGLWLTDSARWPEAGELDASEIEPVDGQNAVTWHSGTTGSEFTASTASFSPLVLPTQGANLSPGWHTVDVVYTKGYFAVYYDGHQFTSYTSSNVTGDPLNVYFTAVNSPDTTAVENAIGGPPVNSANSPSTMAVKYLKIWTCQS